MFLQNASKFALLYWTRKLTFMLYFIFSLIYNANDSRESLDRWITFGMIWKYRYGFLIVQAFYNIIYISKKSVSELIWRKLQFVSGQYCVFHKDCVNSDESPSRLIKTKIKNTDFRMQIRFQANVFHDFHWSHVLFSYVKPTIKKEDTFQGKNRAKIQKSM